MGISHSIERVKHRLRHAVLEARQMKTISENFQKRTIHNWPCVTERPGPLNSTHLRNHIYANKGTTIGLFAPVCNWYHFDFWAYVCRTSAPKSIFTATYDPERQSDAVDVHSFMACFDAESVRCVCVAIDDNMTKNDVKRLQTEIARVLVPVSVSWPVASVVVVTPGPTHGLGDAWPTPNHTRVRMGNNRDLVAFDAKSDNSQCGYIHLFRHSVGIE